MAPPAFLLVFSEPGPSLSETEYLEWYEGEHIPLRIPIPAFQSWTRWVAADAAKPTYAASYDIESYEATQIAPYATLSKNRSEREKDALRRIELLDRRVYEAYEGHAMPEPSALFDPTKPAPIMLLVGIEMKPEFEDELNKWYAEEHIPLLAAVPGWVRSRRFVLRDWSKTGKSVESSKEQEKPPKYLAVHEWASRDSLETSQFKEAVNTSWRDKVMVGEVRRERRVFEFLKRWERQ
ncbi:hypothetical protein A0H81_14973 [Grifola frondosa]|uniref:EthD domain-containing protein n=1 Tax=Grifola frondosa TaxID=5627 RepID=A0A1C7LK12_GRIFR|nr:hypothetical protein A0H81_14973 [Grifola frondosa]